MFCRLHRLSFALTFALFAASSVAAQRERDTYTTGPTLEISGQVRLSELNAPAPDAQVSLERFSGGLVEQMATDRSGRFRFIGLATGNYTVRVSAHGYQTTQQTVDLRFVFKQYLLFELRRDESMSSPRPTSSLVIDARVPKEAGESVERGRAELAKKNTAQAITHFQNALEIYPEYFDAQLLLSTTFMDLREWQKAETSLLKALNLKNDEPMVLLALGEVYWREKRYEEAEKLLVQGTKLDDESWHGHFTLARLYWDQKELMKAAPAVGRTLQLKPDFAEAHLLAGNILLQLNQQRRALVEYQEYLKLEPKGEFAQQTRELVDKLSKALLEKN
jgi:Tfp pilus assembly protein PilF